MYEALTSCNLRAVKIKPRGRVQVPATLPFNSNQMIFVGQAQSDQIFLEEGAGRGVGGGGWEAHTRGPVPDICQRDQPQGNMPRKPLIVKPNFARMGSIRQS